MFKKSRVQAPRERPAANNVRAIRVRIKNRDESVCQMNIRDIRIIRVQKNLVFKPPRERPAANKDPCDPCDPCALKKQSKIRVRIKNRVKSACKKLFVSFGLLPPFGLWAFGESRVQNLVFLM